MELNYFTLYLRNYLRDHSFTEADLEADIVKINADNASTTYANERKAGNSTIGSNELALVDLFVGIGLSRIEAAEDILEDYFEERIQNGTQQRPFEYWGEKLAETESIWEGYHKDGELGLNEELVAEGKDTLRHRIDQFLKTYGV